MQSDIYDIPIKSYNMLSIVMQDSIQKKFAEIWALKNCLCATYGQFKKQMVHKTHFLSYFY